MESDWQLARAARGQADYVFDPIGLLLVNPLEHSDDPRTPSNALTFAATGGDGVHFSLVLREDRPAVDSPVVMTVPFGAASIILGADLDEFLGLGMFRGFFRMEYLASEPEKYAEDYSVNEPWPEDESGTRRLLKRFADGMGLRPWNEVPSRLNQLQREFSPWLTWENEPSGDNNMTF